MKSPGIKPLSYFLAVWGMVVSFPSSGLSQSPLDWRGSVSVSPLYLNTTDLSGSTVSDWIWYGSARLYAEWYPVSWLELAAEPRASVLYTSNAALVEGLLDPAGKGNTFFSSAWKQSTRTGSRELRLNRWTATIRTGSVDLVTGKQRVNWGTNLIWNPLDIFNPRQSFSFDSSDLPSADAVSLYWYPDETSLVNVAIKPGRDRFQQTAAVQFKLNWMETDLVGIAGFSQEIPAVGLGWAGEICTGGFRGEILWRRNYWRYQTETLQPIRSDEGELLAALSGDYTFENSLYIHSEILFQSAGTKGLAAPGYPESVLNNRQSPARWASASTISYQLHPLVRAQTVMLFNPGDHSMLAGPSVNLSLLDNMDGTIQVLHGSGEKNSEFGTIGTIGSLRMVWNF